MLSRHLLLVLGAALASAQVATDCNPLEKTCPADPALGTSHNFNMNETANPDLWENYGGGVEYDAATGAAFTINKQGDSPTLRTLFYFFFGRTEIMLKAAPGRGIVSSMMWLSDDLDEVDWEFLGTNDTHASSNFFGKGVQDWHNGKMHPMNGIHDDYHNFTTDWTKERIEWYIDGQLVRTLTPGQANGTKSYPQTPMRMSIGIWAGGDPSLPKGTQEWAGGTTDYANGPYTMYLKSAYIADYSTGKEYTYSDHSGSFESIKIVDAGKNSTAVETIHKPPPTPAKSTAEKWAELSSGAKIGIYCGAGTAAALAIVALAFYCIKQRRRGAQEALAAEKNAEEEHAELERFKKEGINPDALGHEGVEYRRENDYDRSMNNISRDGSTFQAKEMTTGGPLAERGWDASDAAMAAVVAGGAGATAAAAGGAVHPGLRRTETIDTTHSYSSLSNVPSPRSPPPMGVFNPPQDQMSLRSGTPASMNFHTPMSGGHGPGSPTGMMGGGPRYSDQISFLSGPPSRSQSPMIRTQSPGTPPQGSLPPTPSYQSRTSSYMNGGYAMQAPQRMGSPASTRMNSPGPGRMQSPGPNYNGGGGHYHGGPQAY